MSFKAMFEGGMCPAGCGERIHQGDDVQFVDDELTGKRVLVHIHCTPKPDPFEITDRETICPDCRMVYLTAAGHECG